MRHRTAPPAANALLGLYGTSVAALPVWLPCADISLAARGTPAAPRLPGRPHARCRRAGRSRPQPGTDVAGSLRFRAGGSAANTARTFATLGGRAVLHLRRRPGSAGCRLVASLRAEPVAVHAVRARGPTPRLAALIDESRRALVRDGRGRRRRLAAGRLKRTWLARAEHLHMPAYSLLQGAARARPWRPRAQSTTAAALSRSTLLRTARCSRAAGGRLRGVRAAVEPDLLLANADEAAALVGLRPLHGSTAPDERLLETAPLAVVKQGLAGCRIVWRADSGGVATMVRSSCHRHPSRRATRPVPGTPSTRGSCTP